MENLGDEDISSAVRQLSNLNHIQLCFFRIDLRKLDLSRCKLGDEDIRSAVWELPNLQELYLSRNKFSRLDFSLMRIPRLKLLDVFGCEGLVELSGLPSSIAILEAGYCRSLETFRDISNCKWLWKVSFHWVDKGSPLDGYKLLDSMLKANAIEDHHISVILHHRIPEQFVNCVGRLFKGRKFRLHLPHDWYNEFCGFLIHVVTDYGPPRIDIIIKQLKEVDEYPPFNLLQESDEALWCRSLTTYVGYVPFSSLRHIACSNSTYNVISFFLRPPPSSSKFESIGAALVPRKSKDDPMQTRKLTTDCSGFQDEKYDFRREFTIQHDSKSSIRIIWEPCEDNIYL